MTKFIVASISAIMFSLSVSSGGAEEPRNPPREEAPVVVDPNTSSTFTPPTRIELPKTWYEKVIPKTSYDKLKQGDFGAFID